MNQNSILQMVIRKAPSSRNEIITSIRDPKTPRYPEPYYLLFLYLPFSLLAYLSKSRKLTRLGPTDFHGTTRNIELSLVFVHHSLHLFAMHLS